MGHESTTSKHVLTRNKGRFLLRPYRIDLILQYLRGGESGSGEALLGYSVGRKLIGNPRAPLIGFPI